MTFWGSPGTHVLREAPKPEVSALAVRDKKRGRVGEEGGRREEGREGRGEGGEYLSLVCHLYTLLVHN